MCIRLFLLLAVLGAFAATGAEKPFEILTIGNSFSQNSTRYLSFLIADGKQNARVERAGALGGHSMQKHLSYALAYEKDPADPAGRPYSLKDGDTTRKVGMQDLLKMAKWDRVTIQQLSSDSWQPETYAAATELVRIIKKYAPTAEIVFHETWSYRADDPWLVKNNLTAESMYEKLHAAYNAKARELGLKVIPVGSAFERARKAGWGDSFAKVDRETLVHPALPEQSRSLHVGYRWGKAKGDPPKWVLGYDPRHANSTGEYLGALVWYGFFFGDPEKLTWKPTGMSDETAQTMRTIAAETLRDAREK